MPTQKKNEKKYDNGVLNTIIGFSHLGLIDWIFDNLHIGVFSAMCWGLVQALLTYYFFPQILNFFTVTIGIHFAMPQVILWLVVCATFSTLFMIGASVRETRVCKKIQEALSQNSSIGKTCAIVLILVVTHFLAFGYILEWFAKASLLLPIPVWASWIICSLAIMNLLLFSVERCMNTINVAFKDNTNSKQSNYRQTLIKIGLNVSMHLVLFTALGILPLHYAYPLSAFLTFLALYGYFRYDKKQSVWANIDIIIYDWVFLITHASAEGGVAAAGIALWLQHFITNTSLLHILVIFTLVASTVCEELEDMVHPEEEGSTQPTSEQKNKKPHYRLVIDKWLQVDMLMLFFIFLSGFSTVAISLFVAVNCYYIYILFKRFKNSDLTFRDSVTTLWNLGSKSLVAQALFYASMATALCLGINGGLEFLHMCGTSIGMVFFIAIAGVIIESSVFFDQIKSSDKSSTGEEMRFPIFAFIANLDNILASYALLSMAVSIGGILFICQIANLGTSAYISLGFLVVYGREVFSAFKRALTVGSTIEILLACGPLLILTGALCTVTYGSLPLLLTLTPYYAPIAFITGLCVTYLCSGKDYVVQPGQIDPPSLADSQSRIHSDARDGLMLETDIRSPVRLITGENR